MQVNMLDHFVLTVASIETTCEFYSRVLGMEVVTFGDGRRALTFGEQKINLHEAGNEFDPKAKMPTPGSGDFCLIIDGSIDELVDHCNNENVVIEEGPVQRTGTLGLMTSIYFRDPDGNLVEVSAYPPG